MISQIKSKILVILFLSLNFAYAQLSSFEINGYAKYLFSSSKLPSANERYDDHLLHARLNTHWYPFENFKAAMEMRLRGYYGETVEHTPNFTDRIKGKYDYLDLGAVLWEKKKSVGYGEIDRLYLDWNYDKLQLTLGRQRIAWGTSWAWNPTDIFNPYSVLDFDYEERPAVDAIRAQYYTGPVSKIEFAFKPAEEKENVIAAGLLSLNYNDYDFNFLGGIKYDRWLAGFSWVGDISGAGFRGEVLVSEGAKRIIPSFNSSFGSDNVIYSFVLSGDYTFPNSFYIHTEVLHNSSGVKDLTALFQQQASNIGMLTAARWSLYQEFAYDIHPLVRGTIFGIFNPDDKSFAVIPSVSYSVITNLDLLLLVMLFDGKPLTEYGSYGSAVFIRLKYSF
ncbi:MAG TPA: hypothetical protein VMT35_02860 [Ignavibacteriaceae bacterium]|nr:hypothetical protein [Ignavibacteriaceae bacterium]